METPLPDEPWTQGTLPSYNAQSKGTKSGAEIENFLGLTLGY